MDVEREYGIGRSRDVCKHITISDLDSGWDLEDHRLDHRLGTSRNAFVRALVSF